MIFFKSIEKSIRIYGFLINKKLLVDLFGRINFLTIFSFRHLYYIIRLSPYFCLIRPNLKK